MSNLTKPMLLDETFKEKMDAAPKGGHLDRMNQHLKEIATALKGGSTYEDDIEDIVANIRDGLGPELYPVGTILKFPEFDSATIEPHGTGVTAATIAGHTFCEALGNAKGEIYEIVYDGAWKLGDHYINLTTYGIAITGTPADGDKLIVVIISNDRSFVVVDHDGYTVPHAAPHMTVCALDVIYGRPFDGSEAFYYCESALPAGAYTFNVPETVSSWIAGDYTFTLTNEAAAGSLLKISNVYSTALTSCSVQVFASATATSAAETAAISSGNTGTSLGSLGVDLNHPQRICYGSGNYAQSNIRQFINSEAAATAWYVKSTIYDTLHSTYANMAGYLRNFGRDLKDAMLSTELTLATNSVFETGYTKDSSYTIHDKVFLLSMTELGWGKNNNVSEGALLDYYDGATNADRIKYDISSKVARHWWLRSCIPSSARYARGVYLDGSLSSYLATNGNGLVPAFNLG